MTEITVWNATLSMLRAIPKQRYITGQIQFKDTTPDDVIAYMERNPRANTVEAIIKGMGVKRSTAKRLMGTLADDGRVTVDKDSHPKHFIYSLTDKE